MAPHRRALILLGWVLCACTPLRGISSSEGSAAQSDAQVADGAVNDAEPNATTTGMPARESCEDEGQVRCAAAARQREACEGGVWGRAQPCAEAEVCRDAGDCVVVAEMCRGNAGAALCDDAGVMYQCRDDGAIESSERCSSARHCDLGLAEARCALCLPTEHRCQGDVLERCDSDGRGFSEVEECPRGTCDAQLGTCAGTTCTEARAICVNDVVTICASGESEYREVMQCEPGLCNAEAATCDACVPGIDSCDGDSALRCAADGTLSRVDCSADQGHCVGAGRCVQCREHSDCSGAEACEEDFCRSSDSTCQRRARSAGTSCGGDQVCDDAARCVECTADVHCGDHAVCLANACECQPGYVANPTGTGCNFDECAQFDDNRCGTADGTGNSCRNSVEGYMCSCGAGWTSGGGQCFQSGTGQFVRNGASWDVFPFRVVCENAFDTNNPCAESGQLTMLNVCGLPDVEPNDCSAITGHAEGLRSVSLARVEHAGPLEDFGRQSSRASDAVMQLQAGQVIAIQTLTALVVIRITAFNAEGMTYDWAVVWRDTCWRPGGVTCTAACNCPGGS